MAGVRKAGDQNVGIAKTTSRPEATGPKVRIIEVLGYSGGPKGGGRAKRDPLEMFVHGLAGSGKTSLALTLPAPFAMIVSEPGATAPILSKHGMDRLPRIVTRNWNEFTTGIEGVHGGAAKFISALPSGIEWIVMDTFSSLMTSQHAAHLADAEREWEAKASIARARGKEPPGVDKFKVLDQDLNRGRLIQATLQKSGRNILYLAHTAPMTDDAAANARSGTAGRPVIPGQLRTFLEAWASAILYLETDYDLVREDGSRDVKKVYTPRIILDRAQQPLVKHKWDISGKVDADLGQLLRATGEWPR